MSKIQISLRLAGNLPSSQELKQLLGIVPTIDRRSGEQFSPGHRQPFDIWILSLAEFDGDSEQPLIEAKMQTAAEMLKNMAASVAALDRTHCSAELYVATVQEEEQTRLLLSPPLVAAAASAKLSIQFSVLALFDCSEELEMDTITP